MIRFQTIQQLEKEILRGQSFQGPLVAREIYTKLKERDRVDRYFTLTISLQNSSVLHSSLQFTTFQRGQIKNKCVLGNGWKILGRVGTHISFFRKNIILCIFLNIFFRKPEKIVGFTSKFR